MDINASLFRIGIKAKTKIKDPKYQIKDTLKVYYPSEQVFEHQWHFNVL